jgi:hypothetical protein
VQNYNTVVIVLLVHLTALSGSKKDGALIHSGRRKRGEGSREDNLSLK